ncbi:unnamed protein product [Urochloa humidicola]
MARAAALLLLLAALLPGAAEARTLLTLDDFGAVGDGAANDTKAFADAWAAACAGGSKVFLNVPAAKTFRIWPLTLAGPCRGEIKLLISGNIVAPDSPYDWGSGDRGQWLHFRNVHNLQVTGGGIIDGKGQQWWAAQSACEEDENCTAQPAPKVSSCDLLHWRFGLISTGDDCVSIVGNCTDVRLRAISCGPGHGISIGTLGVDNSIDYVEKIKIDTLFISNAENGVRVRTAKNGGDGFARKVKFESIIMRNVTNPIIVDQGNSNDPSNSSEAVPAGTTVQVQQIEYVDITGTSASENAITFSCSDATPCKHLSLSNVNLTRVDGRNASSYCYNAFGRSSGTVIPESCLSKEDYVQLVPWHSEEEDADS